MEPGTPNYREMMKVAKTIHFSLAIVLVSFGAVVLWMNLTDPAGELSSENEFFLYIPSILLVVAFPSSSIVFKNQIKQQLTESMRLNEKFAVFQTAHLIRIALFEVPGLFAVVVCFITGNNYNLGILILVLLMFLLLAPSISKVSVDLGLSNAEKEQLENG